VEAAVNENEQQVIVVSVDIETTGPSPAVASMLSVGAVAYDESGAEVGEFYRTLLELGEHGDGQSASRHNSPLRDPGTMEWWQQWPEQWALATLSPEEPHTVMRDFSTWVGQLPGRAVFLAWPAGFDWSFVCHYFWKYTGGNPFGYSPLCLKAFGAGLVGKAEAMLSSREESFFPDEWVIQPEFPHHALHDARAQGRMWLRMKRYAETRGVA
jgi:hypothetical protein